MTLATAFVLGFRKATGRYQTMGGVIRAPTGRVLAYSENGRVYVRPPTGTKDARVSQSIGRECARLGIPIEVLKDG